VFTKKVLKKYGIAKVSNSTEKNTLMGRVEISQFAEIALTGSRGLGIIIIGN